ncbi:hypothetical protein GLYMA_09G039700v4 [Glycine max]|uniref:Uncharacterized protein n=1 Tax=Glycine max TaxID=3847 RepID=K7LBR1_SOYBN|nr:hypothetical protein JHK85_024519 [Glycine max]KAG5011766.1 hypothetical protein JHK86_024027 [Glycine max]KAH1041383.1 hypothetical protein GYH30_023967 [Glycine max]KRH37031.1 hypothetical protein GLYMA_09G039700v4 [Glycine max]
MLCLKYIYLLGITMGRFYVAVAETILCGSGWVFLNAAFESYYLLSRSCIGNLYRVGI